MIISILLPLFLLVALGWGLAKLNWLKPHRCDQASKITAQLLLPTLLFYGSYRYGLPNDAPLTLLAAFYLPMLVIFAVVMWFNRHKTNHPAFALSAIYSNNVFLGVPIVTHVIGEAGLKFAFMVIAFHSLLAFSLYYLASAKQPSASRWQPLVNTLKNPIVLSLVLGLLFNRSGIVLPELVLSGLSLVSQAALPGALLVLGASLARLSVSHHRSGLIIALIKLISLPLAVLAMARLVLGLSDQITVVLIILSACPVGISVYSVVAGDGRDPALVSSAILLSTIGCVITLPLWLMMLLT